MSAGALETLGTNASAGMVLITPKPEYSVFSIRSINHSGPKINSHDTKLVLSNKSTNIYKFPDLVHFIQGIW